MASEELQEIVPISLASSSLKSETERFASWTDLRNSVRSYGGKFVTPPHGCPPSSFVFSSCDGAAMCRVFFLGAPDQGKDLSLLYCDVSNTVESPVAFSYNKVFDCTGDGDPWTYGSLSKEEQLACERKRIGSSGITSYDCHLEGRMFIFPANGSLYRCDFPADLQPSPVRPVLVETKCLGSRMDPKICPIYHDVVAFINRSDIYVTSLSSETEMRLTFTHGGTASDMLSDNPISAGAPSFIMSEEFSRFTGFWWLPLSRDHSAASIVSGVLQTLRLLYEEVDESDVEVVRIVSPTTTLRSKGCVEEYRYPRVGTANARSALKIVTFDVDSSGLVSGSVTTYRLPQPLTHYCPPSEYLTRAGSTPDGKHVYCQLLDRSQRRLCLLLFPMQRFVPTDQVAPDLGPTNSYPSLSGPTPSPPAYCIYEETSSVWINVHDLLHFLPSRIEGQCEFLWASQKSGFRHLYLITSQLPPPSLLLEQPCPDLSTGADLEGWNCLRCPVLQETQLTSGDWEVLPNDIVVMFQLWVDEVAGLVYFMGLKDSPLESHLYAVSYLSAGREPQRLTESGFSHSVTVDPVQRMFVTTFSSVSRPPVTSVCHVMCSGDGTLSVDTCGSMSRQSDCSDHSVVTPLIFSFVSCRGGGHRLYGVYCLPLSHQPGQRCPTVVFVYGGPHVQLVTNSFKSFQFARLHTLAAHGYAVVMVDGRGSANRGVAFESHLKDRLGTVEIDDQVEGIQWLADNEGFIDLSRVALHGWSYGGYLALLGLGQRADFFKVAIAGAPVVSWEMYDTGYTERYLSLPATNPTGYQLGSVLHYLHRFPDQDRRLLLIHGLMDENVHFDHTSLLVSALVKACKPHMLQVYPSERHGVRSAECNEHYNTLLLSFLQAGL